jgi:hypothetical protein
LRGIKIVPRKQLVVFPWPWRRAHSGGRGSCRETIVASVTDSSSSTTAHLLSRGCDHPERRRVGLRSRRHRSALRVHSSEAPIMNMRLQGVRPQTRPHLGQGRACQRAILLKMRGKTVGAHSRRVSRHSNGTRYVASPLHLPAINSSICERNCCAVRTASRIWLGDTVPGAS